MRDQRATFIGFGAVLLWALLALFTAATGGVVPPFQLAAVCFAIGGLIGVAVIILRGGALRPILRQPWRVWALGVGGIFGYHFFYFTALRHAPVAEASLIAYLWPLLIVLLSGLMPGERLRVGHLAGAFLGFAGAALLIAPGWSGGFGGGSGPGYAAAGLCALIWSSYSVLSRRFAAAPTEAVAGFCLVAAVLAALCHRVFEAATVWPADAIGWAGMIALGLGPVGAAFYLWDHGVKRGDIQLLGVASYAAPLLSTLILVLAGLAPATPVLALACVLIVGGAVLAALAGRAAAQTKTPGPGPGR